MTYERLSAQDALFLELETSTQPMHVGSLALFEAGPFYGADGQFRLDEVRDVIAGRLHLVPRFRKRLMFVPLEQGRPVWVDDEHFDLHYHVRLTSLPAPGSEDQLLSLVARLQAPPLDRTRPLWELWFVEGVATDKVGLIQRTHHALVDGISGVDVATVLLDFEADPEPEDPPGWEPAPPPGNAELMIESLVERMAEPAAMLRRAREAIRDPERAGEALAYRALQAGGTIADANQVAPELAWNRPLGAQRVFAISRVDLSQARRIKSQTDATINDIVLAASAGALRRLLQAQGELTDDLVLRALVPVSMRDESERMALGNRVAPVVADLPVGLANPAEQLQAVTATMSEVKASGRAVGADTLLSLGNFAPPTLLGMAARLVARQRAVNLGVTNVPGPQVPLYCMGARLLEAFPYVAVVDGLGLMIGVVSYDGQLGFGLTADTEALPELADLADGVSQAFDDLEEAVGP